MAMERWEMEMRRRGNVAGAEIARVLREQHGDVSLGENELETGVSRFSSEQRKELERQGRVIVELTGQSIKRLREQGRKFWSSWHSEHPDFESRTSRLSEVAINPSELFLPGSNGKTLQEQEKMIADFSKKLGRKVGGVMAIMGEAADYVDLAFAYFDKTGKYLFGEKYNYDYARTKTPSVGSSVALVGSFRRDSGLGVSDWFRGDGDDLVWAVPLVVPVETG